MSGTSATIIVSDEQELINALQSIDAGTVTDASGQQTNNVTLQFADNITLNQSFGIDGAIDLPVLDNANANVTINGSGYTLNGQGEVSGLRVLDGAVNLQNLTMYETVAQGGAGGDGLAGGGGGAGLGGGLFVGSDASVTLSDDFFIGDAAVGGSGGQFDSNDDEGGGGGGLGGAGDPGGDSGLGGGGGGGIGQQTAYGLQGTAMGAAGGGSGGGQAQNTQAGINIVGFFAPIGGQSTLTSGAVPGLADGGAGGYGGAALAGGGGGGIGGQAAQNFNDGSVQESEIFPGANLLSTAVSVALGAIDPAVAVAEGLAQTAGAIYDADETGDWSAVAIAGIATDAVLAGASAYGAYLKYATSEYQSLTDIIKTDGEDAFYAALFTKLAVKGAIMTPDYILEQVLQEHRPFQTGLTGAYDPISEGETGPLPNLQGQSSTVTTISSTGFETDEPTAGGAGGWGGGGGGGGGVGGSGGFGGGGGGGGTPSKDEDFDAGNGGFGGGGGGGGLNAKGGTGGFGAGDGTDGAYLNPATGQAETFPGVGGGGLGAGGGIFVESGGQLTFASTGSVQFSNDYAQGGVGINPGMGLGNDLFVQGAATLNLDQHGTIDLAGGIGDQNGAEAGFTDDQVGLDIGANSGVELGNVNLFTGFTTVGDAAAGAQNEAVEDGPQGSDPASAGFTPNGFLEMLPGSTFSNQLIIEAYAGATIQMDAGSTFTGSLYLGNLNSGDPLNLIYTPNADATTAAEVLPWSVDVFPGGTGGSIDMVGVQSDGTSYDSVLNVNGTLRIVRFSPDGWNGLGTELTLLPQGGDFYNVDSLAGIADINWALAEEGKAAPSASIIVVAADNANDDLELAPGTTLAPIANQSVYISAILTDPQTAAGSLIIDGDPSALVDFQVPSDFSGGVTLQSGTLEFDNAAGAGSGPVIADAGFGNVVALVVVSGFDTAVTITSGTLNVDQANGWGSGTLTLAPNGSPIAVEIGQDAMVQTGNSFTLAAPIDGFGNQAVIDLTGLAYNPDAALDTVSAAGGTLTVSNGTVTDFLTVPNLPAGGLAVVEDAQGGTEIFNAITVSNEAQWDAAITQVDGETTGGYAILFTADFSTSQDAPVISLASGVSLAIQGAGHTLDGGGQNRGLFVDAGSVTLNDLTIANALAQGGAGSSASGGGGGGGAGLGGGLFVESGAAVTLDNVNFAGDAAVGGTGGFGGDGEQPGNGGGFGLGNANGGSGIGGSAGSFGGGGYGGFGTRGAGGFGGGAGGLNPEVGGNGEGGGGGLGAGGDIFLQLGATLTILGGTLSGGAVTGGTAGNGATGGEALGSGIFLQGDEEITFAPLSGVTETIADSIADQNGDGGSGGIILDGPGTLALTAENSFRGGVTLAAGTLELGNAQAAGTGGVTFATDGTTIIMNGTTLPANVLTGFAPTDTIDLADIAYDPNGTATLNATTDVLTLTEHGQTYALNFDASVNGQHFQLASYGNGAGTEIEVTGLLPTINGLGGTSYVNTGSTTDLPFAGVTIGDANLGGPIDTLRITLSDPHASLNPGTSTTGATFTSAGNGSYTLTGTATGITNVLHALTLNAPSITRSLEALNVSLALDSSAGPGTVTAAARVDIVGPGLGRTYGYSGQIESFTASVSGIYNITADGAQGGGNYRATGGLGAMAGGEIYLAAGTELEIVTGGAGAPGNLTGAGTISSGGGGGGGSFVIETATAAGQLAAPLLLVVAGGGGGAGQTSGGGGLSLGSGGRGLGFIYGAGGAEGAPGFASENSFGGGGGGFTGGESGNLIESGGNGAVAAQSFAGGAARLGGGSGGFGGGGAGGAASSGGGGGGGYGGGGGGGTHGAGGGGGSYIAADATGVALAAATHTGAGLVTVTLETVECFARCTNILTPDGERPVETLRPGDLVTLHGGAAAPVRWIGQRRVNCQRHPKPEQVWPIQIQPGAFAPGRPHRALLLSPDHAVFAEDVLIPVKYLVNGTTIAQVAVDEIEYFHVELDRHGVIRAEGLPCETYLDAGNRDAFTRSRLGLPLPPRVTPAESGEAIWEAAGCAPLAVAGAAFERVAAQLRSRANIPGRPANPEPKRNDAAPAIKFHQLLNPEWYLSRYQDVASAGVDPVQHYADSGWREGRLPCPEMDLIRALGMVDPVTAIFTMPDVLAAGLDPVAHFCTHGWRERRRPNLYFDTSWYADTHEISAHTNPLLHYLRHGERQNLPPSRNFNAAWYREYYKIGDRESPLAHYLRHRRAQRFSPLPSFDVDAYCAAHAATLRPGRDPYAHFLAFGQMPVAQGTSRAA
jgi:hypothetical protein